jgi:prepilin-type N-terminal cleavage/methylation domain-containing protein
LIYKKLKLIKMKKGFTLIELLIVIGILAVLSSAVVVVLNPAQLLAQARDTQRLNDLSSLSSAISYFLSTTNLTSSLMAPGSAGNACATNWWGSYASIGVSPFTVPAATILPGNQSAQVSRAVTGTGWVPVKLDKSNDGNGPSPLGTLPVDPTNASGKFYAYSCNENNKTFELNSLLESGKYAPMMAAAKDGGDNDSYYETGNSFNL